MVVVACLFGGGEGWCDDEDGMGWDGKGRG